VGYITSRVGFGTWVNRVEAPRPARQATTTPAYIRRVISTYKRPQPWVDLAFVDGIRPFRIGVPAINEFPSEVWGRIAADRARNFRSWLKKEADIGHCAMRSPSICARPVGCDALRNKS
jgi:GntR family transcriptional regulator/MocR family aminotransferase